MTDSTDDTPAWACPECDQPYRSVPGGLSCTHLSDCALPFCRGAIEAANEEEGGPTPFGIFDELATAIALLSNQVYERDGAEARLAEYTERLEKADREIERLRALAGRLTAELAAAFEVKL